MSRTLRSLVLTAVGMAALRAYAAPPANSAYITDAQSSYVQDATSQSIGQVNMITCVMSSMRPDALVNKGAYIALVDKNVCDSTKSSVSSSTASAGSAQAPDYMHAVVNATRASNSDPMLVSAWITIDQDGQPVTVYARISATEVPSSTNPYGAFRLDYCGKSSAGGGCLMNGFIQGGSGALNYYETDNGGQGSQTTALNLSSVGTTSGSGSLSVTDSGNGGGSSGYDFAYDQQYFLRNDSQGGSECFSRDASDPATGLSVWQYGLYDSITGDRVQRNSGFPIQYTQGGVTYQGYAGYYGMSLPPGAPVPADGSTVQKVDYQNGAATTTSFTVATNGGRLTRYTKQSRTLQSIDQIHFNTWIGDTSSFGLPDPNTSYEMYWDESSSKFIAVGEQLCGQNGCQLSNFSVPVSLDPSLWVSMGGVQGWSQSLGGDLFVNLTALSGAIDPATITVVSHVQDLVYPDDTTVPATLYCASNCPTAASLHGYFTQIPGTPVASPYLTGSYNNFQPLSAAGLATYQISGAVLSDDAHQQVVDTNASDYQAYPQYNGGVASGRLFVNLTDAQCGTDPNAPTYCDYQVNSANVYYVWQTGPSSWNQFAAVKNSGGSFVHFDAPLNVNFTVPAGNAYGSYAGTSIVLQYNNFGDLWGIPGTCVSQTTNMTVDCSAPNSRFVPQFVIPYDPTATPQHGVVTNTSNGTTTSYLVKWLQREIRFAVKDASVCTGDHLQTPTSVSLPTPASLKDPSSTASDVYLGIEPTVTDAPRVIQGEVKY